MSKETDNLWKSMESQILKDTQKEHLKLMKWLHDNYRNVLEQYCDEELNGIRVGFLGGKEK